MIWAAFGVFCVSVAAACFATMVTLMVVGASLNLSDHGLEVGATISVPFWTVFSFVVLWPRIADDFRL